MTGSFPGEHVIIGYYIIIIILLITGNPGDLLNITAVTVTPMPPKRGQSVTISANVTLGTLARCNYMYGMLLATI